jgi:hypothetical protein
MKWGFFRHLGRAIHCTDAATAFLTGVPANELLISQVHTEAARAHALFGAMPAAAAAAGRALALRQQVLSADDPRVQQSSQYVQELQAYSKLMAVGNGTGRSPESDPVQPFLQQLTDYIMETQRSQASGSGRAVTTSAAAGAGSTAFSHQQLAAWLNGITTPATTSPAMAATDTGAKKSTTVARKSDATEARRVAQSVATTAAAVAAAMAPPVVADEPHRPYQIDDIDESDDTELLVRVQC